jgi:hypothetical protein
MVGALFAGTYKVENIPVNIAISITSILSSPFQIEGWVCEECPIRSFQVVRYTGNECIRQKTVTSFLIKALAWVSDKLGRHTPRKTRQHEKSLRTCWQPSSSPASLQCRPATTALSNRTVVIKPIFQSSLFAASSGSSDTGFSSLTTYSPACSVSLMGPCRFFTVRAR